MHQHDIIRKQHGYFGLSHLDSLHQCRRHGDAQDKNSSKYAYNQISINNCQIHFINSVLNLPMNTLYLKRNLFSQFQDAVVDFWITGVTWGPGPGAATRTRTVWRAAGPRAARAMATPGTGERRERGSCCNVYEARTQYLSALHDHN